LNIEKHSSESEVAVDKVGKLRTQLGKLQDAAVQPDYSIKVPEAIRQQNAEKMEEMEAEIAKLSQGMQRLAKID